MADAEQGVVQDADEPPTFVRRHDVGGQELAIHQDPLAAWKTGNGASVWDAALALGAYLEQPAIRAELCTGKRLFEVGAGTGFVGLCAAALGAGSVVLADRRCALPLLRKNVALVNAKLPHERAVCAVAELEWGDAEQAAAAAEKGLDVVIVSDCVHWPELFAPLIDSLVALAGEQRRGAVVLISYEERNAVVEDEFFEQLRRRFDVRAVPAALQAEDYRDPSIFIFRCTLLL